MPSALSSSTHAILEINSLFVGTDYSCSLPRARFEELNKDYFRNSMGPVEKYLRDSGIGKHNVHEVGWWVDPRASQSP